MTKKILAASIVFALSLPASAQFSTDSIKQKNTQVAKTDAGTLLLTLAEALKPDSYKSSYSKEKKEFIKRVKSAKDAAALATNIAQFVKYVKPDKFRKDINVEELILQAGSATTLRKSAKNLIDIENALKPDAISSMWSLTKAGWKTDLNQLQQSSK